MANSWQWVSIRINNVHTIIIYMRCAHVEKLIILTTTMAEEKVSKKKQKALSFRKTKEDRELEKKEKEEAKAEAEAQALESKKRALEEETTAESDEPKKKRKTRRGKKGKGVNGGKGPRFILFIGNLPYDIKEPELLAHFKNANPDRFRIRKDKGIAFMEFDNESREIQSKMDNALRMHHLVLRNRKINVELTVGGGGNSENRTAKLKEKNEKLGEERRQRVKTELNAKKEKADLTSTGMHPARAALLNQS